MMKRINLLDFFKQYLVSINERAGLRNYWLFVILGTTLIVLFLLDIREGIHALRLAISGAPWSTPIPPADDSSTWGPSDVGRIIIVQTVKLILGTIFFVIAYLGNRWCKEYSEDEFDGET